MICSLVSSEILFDQDVVYIRNQARLIAELLGFSSKDQASICTVASEIARNCILYANGGIAHIAIVGDAPSCRLSIEIKDQGPGISNLNDVLNGQFQSKTGLGIGISASRRLLPDYFNIETVIGHGTKVIFGKLLPDASQSLTKPLLARLQQSIEEIAKESPLELVRQRSEVISYQSEVSQQNMLNSMHDGYLRLDSQGYLTNANSAYSNQSGYTRDELLGMHISDLEAVDSKGEIMRRISANEECVSDHFESSHRRKDDSLWIAEVSLHYINTLAGVFFVFVRDVTERKQIEQELRIAAMAFESHIGAIVTDENGIILKVNSAFTSITGYGAEEVVGKSPRLLKSGMHNKDFYSAMWSSIINIGKWEGEIWDRKKNGEGYAQHITITAVKNDLDMVANYVALFTDITESKIAADEIQQLAFYDPLTKLPNRRLLINRLKQAIAASNRSGLKGALIFIDLDNFKLLNDTSGHNVGDMLLQRVGERLTSCCREIDTAARIGGDEFVVLLEGLSSDFREAAIQAEGIGNKILTTLNQSCELKLPLLHITASIGITLLSDHEFSFEDSLRQADIAMYQAKKAGRNTIRFFDPKMQEALNHRAELESDLRNAIISQQLAVFYQLQVNNEGKPVGAEVLVRWLHPKKGVVSPANFIPLAEEVGLIVDIGSWVMEQAFKQLLAWQQNEITRHLTLSVNVSPKQFHQHNFIEQVRDLLSRYRISPKLLKLELTESMLFDNVESTVQIISTLKSLGIGFSLDDFGTGYSSLQYLKSLPLDQLKIDQSFVRDISIDQNDALIVRTIIVLAHSLGLEVIAEGVESQSQLNYLADNGCYHFQGYLFGKPMPVKEFEQLLKQQHLNIE